MIVVLALSPSITKKRILKDEIPKLKTFETSVTENLLNPLFQSRSVRIDFLSDIKSQCVVASVPNVLPRTTARSARSTRGCRGDRVCRRPNPGSMLTFSSGTQGY